MAPIRRAHRAALCVLSALLLALVAPLTLPTSAQAAPFDPALAIAQVEPTLVQITTMNDFQGVIGNGTGIVVSPDGLVLTNHHVVQGANVIRATSVATGQGFDADVVGYARSDDIALLRLRGASGLPVAPLGDSNTVMLGEPVMTIGNANGTGAALTHETGEITALDRTIEAEDELTGSSHALGGLIESSTNLRSGDSGGALVNSAGQVIGMNAAATVNFRLDGQVTPGGQGFAIPINRVLDVANQIRAGIPSAEVHIGPSAMLGIGVDANPRRGSRGLPVRSLLRGGPADVAGLRAGDIIVAIDGRPISSANDLTSMLDARYPGDVIDVAWLQPNGVPRAAKVTLVPGPVT
ncbi:trypsin-like peptidase domain-containing protein [[Mycobacterium] wendilense]|uniref:Trypsin-like peptidase domain-containing protein n=1 Tax=[Mycobacterium] wendilense TaxID=3064284 RepID=A0ABM9M8C2_9MYCO|nr:trypsin-like peptidase domain-containing protein [Mycolicibacterium sp. MU0050]